MLIPIGFFGGAPASAYEFISTSSITTSTPSVTFDVSALTGTYKHLQLRLVARSVSSNANIHARFNGDTTAANYSMHQLYGTGSSVGSASTTNAGRLPAIGPLPPSTSHFGVSIVDFVDVFSSTKNKVVKSLRGFADPGAGLSDIELVSAAWYSTSPVTSILVYGDYNFAAGTRLSLYGIKG